MERGKDHFQIEITLRRGSNPRPLPCQSSQDRFYNNLEDRGDCQNTRKSYKTSLYVGWSVGWQKASLNPERQKDISRHLPDIAIA